MYSSCFYGVCMLVGVSGKKEEEGMQFDLKKKKKDRLTYLEICKDGALQWRVGGKEQNFYKDFHPQTEVVGSWSKETQPSAEVCEK